MLEWERGRQLKQYGDISFTYDAGGVRQSKTANGVTTSYFTEGNRIHKEERSDGKTLIYAYDESGIATITYNGTLYYVQKNFQGDIVALVDQSGNVVAKYVYDAWGVCKVYDANGTENTSNSFIGNINPFRYRGYYYDAETGLYYLQTRYYEPQAGRFLSPDSVDYIAPDLIGGLNLYAYCNNNPVMYSDPDGTFVWALIGAVAGAIASVIGRFIGDKLSGKHSTWQEYVGSAIGGAVSGAHRRHGRRLSGCGCGRLCSRRHHDLGVEHGNRNGNALFGGSRDGYAGERGLFRFGRRRRQRDQKHEA